MKNACNELCRWICMHIIKNTCNEVWMKRSRHVMKYACRKSTINEVCMLRATQIWFYNVGMFLCMHNWQELIWHLDMLFFSYPPPCFHRRACLAYISASSATKNPLLHQKLACKTFRQMCEFYDHLFYLCEYTFLPVRWGGGVHMTRVSQGF